MAIRPRPYERHSDYLARAVDAFVPREEYDRLAERVAELEHKLLAAERNRIARHNVRVDQASMSSCSAFPFLY